MKTGTGVEIKLADLNYRFVYKGKICPIGQFDPSDYPSMKHVNIRDMAQEVFDQLEDSGVFSSHDLEKIATMSEGAFNECIELNI